VATYLNQGLSGRFWRWADKVNHVAGSKNTATDAFGRVQVVKTDEQEAWLKLLERSVLIVFQKKKRLKQM